MTPVDEALAELRDRDAVTRLHDRDATLWSDDPAVRDAVANRLGWLDVAAAPPGWSQRLSDLGEQITRDGITRVVLAGMGGSSLAPELFASVFGGDGRGATLTVLDSTHPDAVAAALDPAGLDATLVVVSSKSGSTEETRSFAALAGELVPSARLFAVTDAGSQLKAQARDGGWRDVAANPADIGGRYSALSLFGMLPAALVGVDVDVVWASGAAMLDRCRATPEDNPGAQLAAFIAGCARAGRDKLTLLTPTSLASLGDWVEQLVAESTGKQGRGIVPVVGEPVGEPGVYGDDRAFVALSLGGETPLGVDALAAAGHPVHRIDVAERTGVGGEFVRWEVAVALAGALLGVNPFDEPNVSESKANTNAVLDAVAGGGSLDEPEHGDVAALLDQLRPGDYCSVQAYLAPNPATAAPLQRLRTTVRDRYRVATTFGWGPRFLHSTGQLHKGGPNTVVALQVVERPTGGPPIPGRDYDFATLIRAQAQGDLRSLRDHGRRVAQVSVAEPGALESLAAAVEGATR
ncbi:MAG: glucose-6-phosphate isomerase [Actinomycetota bacterium]|nr:glucose-6-phosphate isomerase [Actinomycetota bacterium]